MKPDYSLYLVTDRKMMSTRTLGEAVVQAVAGGCTMVQLREKEISALDFYMLALEIKKITDRYGIPLIINDRIDIAMAVGAAGVHIGQKDIPADIVRKVIGKDKLLGVSAGSVAEAVKAVEAKADYLGVGAMFPTETKPDAKYVSMEELREIRRAVDIPIVVIGDINRENAMLFKSMGIDGLAVVSAVIAESDIKKSASTLRSLFLGKEPMNEL
ncbi:thiamine phosphate synthase [Sporofaciens musculi]|uniref:thiamine phosphate synthase n=1 Tax=Sporofaciens musculi TaxID=2681861 RepID=UPI00259D0B97|nr:thiamine phosphate synthase [Sporofaciens musculi]